MNCPNPKSLQALLDETLPAEEQPTVQAHLDTCVRCQKVLEHLAAGGATWDRTAENLTPRPVRDETELFRVVEKLQEMPTSADQTRAEAPTGPIDVDLSFLAPSQRPDALGRLDEYEVLAVVGKGGFGIVLKAFEEELHRIVAIKVLAPEIASSGTARERFVREAKAAAAVTHENIVTIHRVEKKAKIPYLVMQFIGGVTLSEKIDRAGLLSVKEILRIGTQISEGLAAAHKQGVIHRDIKPGNILLENGVERVKITDFGLARLVDDASVTQSGTVAGTPMFMSPEQANGEPVDLRSDLFSLGSVLYVMCAGKAPFRASSTMAVMKRVCDETPRPIQESNPDIPVWLSDIVTKLHAKKPEDRFQTAKEVAELLGRHLAEVQAGRAASVSNRSATPATIDATTPVAHASGSPRSRRRRWTWAAALLLVVVGAPALLVAWLGTPWGPSRQATVSAKGIAGQWESDWGPVTLIHKPINGTNPVPVTGFFQPEPDKKGTITEGSFDPVQGLLKITCAEPWRAGTSSAVLKASSDGNKLEGTWTNDSAQSGIWTMLRKSGSTAEPPDTDGWVHLFNGKDLSGWKHDSANWTIKDGILIANGKGRIETQRDFTRPFKLRMEVEVQRGQGVIRANTRAAGVRWFAFLREADGKTDKQPRGTVTAALDSSVPGPHLHVEVNDSMNRLKSSPALPARAALLGSVAKVREWFTVELTVGEYPTRLEFLESGKWIDVGLQSPSSYLPAPGPIEIEIPEAEGELHIRKIEIMELPPAPSAAHALLFDGKAMVRVPGLKLGTTGPHTIEAYVTRQTGDKEDTGGIAGFIEQSSLFLHRDRDEAKAAFNIKRADGTFPAAPASSAFPTERTHVAGVWTGSQLRVYVNGKRVADQIAAPGPTAPAGLFVIGGYFRGTIGEVRVSDSARYSDDFTPAIRFQPDEHTLALYHCDEGTPDKLLDSSGKGHHGVFQGTQWVRRSESPTFAGGYALEFDGKTSYVTLPWKYKGDHPLTVEAWAVLKRAEIDAKVDTLISNALNSGFFINSKCHDDAGWGFGMHFGDYEYAIAKQKMPRQRLVHIAGVHDGKGELRFYIGGKLQERRAVQGAHRLSTRMPLTLGADPDVNDTFDDFLKGQLHGVRISKVARYDNDFLPQRRFASDADTVALYPCDDGAGSVLRDFSGNGHHGKIVGAAWVKVDSKFIDPGADAIRQGRYPAPDFKHLKPFFEDRFNDAESGWGTDKGEYYKVGYGDDRYFIDLTPNGVRAQWSPANSPGDFACELVGRTTGLPTSSWGLETQNRADDRFLNFNVNGKQELEIIAAGKNAAMFKKIGPIRHEAIKPGDQFNKLLVISRAGWTNIYVNGVAVCEPLEIDFVKSPATFAVVAHAGKNASRAEFERFTLWDAESMPVTSAPRRYQNSLGMEFAVVPQGKAWLGGGAGKEGEHEVHIKDDFYLGAYEVTQEQWEKVLGLKHPFYFSRNGEGKDEVAGVTDEQLRKFPAENVSWKECQMFLKKLNELDQKPGWEYRLPTEEEWEYACRGGPGDKLRSAFDFYLQEPTNLLMAAQANFRHDQDLKRTREVGAYPPNNLGLYDMHGNVAELTHNPQETKDDDGVPHRNERGGGWTNNDHECRASGRHAWSVTDRFRDVGLRVALVRVR